MATTQHEPHIGRREANKRDKLLRIRRASRKVFLEKGYEEATLREIADAAEVAFGTLFLYAKNKKDLLLLLFDQALPEVTARAHQEAARDGLLTDQLMRFFGELYAFFSETPALSRDMMREFTFRGGTDAIVAPRLWQEVRVIEQHLAEFVARAQQEGQVHQDVKPGLAAHVFFRLHQAEIRSCLDSDEPDVLASMARLREQIELVLAGVGPR